MQITNVLIQNFRTHAHTEIPVGQLGCLIGENNAGKSSVLHAVQFALEERRLSEQDRRESGEPIVVALTLSGIEEADLRRVSDEHRGKIREILTDRSLTIVRTLNLDGKAESAYRAKRPVNKNLREEVLGSIMKGKAGSELRSAVVEAVPELEPSLPQRVTQTQVKNCLRQLVESLGPGDFTEETTSFPTGISASIRPLYPSVIYIEAVKDVSEEAKTTGASAFSKLLEMLFEGIESEFHDMNTGLEAIYRRLNHTIDNEGRADGGRLKAVQDIEDEISRHVKEAFPGVFLRMTFQQLTLPTLLANAVLEVDDGHLGPITSKGDGLKRTVLFALIRAYTSLRVARDLADDSPKRSYILLFEEPELYLHPRAQQQLMEALRGFAADHQVLVTTHSPGFFGPGVSGFTKLRKDEDGVRTHSVSLSGPLRDEYRLIRYENNEAAFFSSRVVLVEGDSDRVVYPHLAKLLDPAWDAAERNVAFVKTEGKGNFKAYKRFFSQFDVPVHIIADTDALVRGFENIDPGGQARKSHRSLMERVDELLPESDPPANKKVKKWSERGDLRAAWERAKGHAQAWREKRDDESLDDCLAAMEEIFDIGNNRVRLEVLISADDSTLADQLGGALSSLYAENIYVLKRGALEAYCGTAAESGKIEKALKFCQEIGSEDAFARVHGDQADEVSAELREIFSRIYD